MPYQSGSSAQRIRIGLTGLALAFLLVLLGSIISRSSREEVSNAASRPAPMKRPRNRANRSPSWGSRPALPTPDEQQRDAKK